MYSKFNSSETWQINFIIWLDNCSYHKLTRGMSQENVGFSNDINSHSNPLFWLFKWTSVHIMTDKKYPSGNSMVISFVIWYAL